MNFDRPIIKITPSRLDILLDILSAAGLLFLWIFTIIQYSKLPDIIPIHFDLHGTIDNYGNKASVFLLPGIISIVFFGLTILNKYPHIFNYTKKINAENAVYEYTRATRLIRIIKLIIVVFTIILTIDIIQSAKKGYSTLPWWIIPIFMFSMILPIIVSFYTSSVDKQKRNN